MKFLVKNLTQIYSECEEAVGDDSDDELTFLRAVATSSGQAVKVI